MCFGCRTKLSIFARARKCQACQCRVCGKCSETRVLPGYMFDPDDPLKGKPLNLCVGCRGGMGGVSR